MAGEAGRWQDGVAAQIAKLAGEAGASAVLVVGSVADSRAVLDNWSDLDVVVVLPDEADQRARPAWIDTIGAVFTYTVDHYVGSVHHVTFEGFRRVDIIAIRAADLGPLVADSGLFGAGFRILRTTPEITRILGTPARPKPAPAEPAPGELEATAQQFYAKAVMAVTRIARDDLLMGTTLALDMVRDCVALAMTLRDRGAGTSHHRRGAADGHVLDEFAGIDGLDREGLLLTVSSALLVFDQLAAQLEPGFRGRGRLVFEWMDPVVGD